MQSALFIQSPPVLGNQYGDDAFLREFLRQRPPAIQWLSHNDDARGLPAAARRFAAAPVDLFVDINREDSARPIE